MISPNKKNAKAYQVTGIDDVASKNNWKAWIYLAPVLVLLSVFLLYPLINTIFIAFMKNYNYIDGFARYYFVNDVKSVRNGVWELSSHVDVLQSFRTGILNQPAIIARQEKYWNLFINDGQFKVYQNSIIGKIPFPSGFSAPTGCYTLAVAGTASGGGGGGGAE